MYLLTIRELLRVEILFGRTVLHLTKTANDVQSVINILQEEDQLECICEVDNDGNTAVMYMAKRGLHKGLQSTLQYMEDTFDSSCLQTILLWRNKERQNIFHLAAICPLAKELFNVLTDYLDILELEEVLAPDKYNNTPFMYLAARYSTAAFAELLLKLPTVQRYQFLEKKNRRRMSCISSLQQGQFDSKFYLRDILCQKGILSYQKSFADVVLDVENLYLAFPGSFLKYDGNILRVIKYALNEYSPMDLQVSPHTHSLLWFHFDGSTLSTPEIQQKVDELDVLEYHGKPKVGCTSVSYP